MTSATPCDWIRFFVREDEYALPLEVVGEVTVSARPRLIPLISSEIAGVINVKGEPLPALDGGVLLRGRPAPGGRRALVLHRDTLRVGLMVDSVSKIETRLDFSRCEPADPPPGARPIPGLIHWLSADGGRLGLVDPDALLGRVGDLLTRQIQHTQEERESWPNSI